MALTICLVISDIILARVYTIGFNLYGSNLFSKLLSFALLATGAVILLNLATFRVNLGIFRSRLGEDPGLRRFSKLSKIVVLTLSAILSIVLFEVLVQTSYYVLLAIVIVGISYIFGILSFLVLAFKYYRWLKVNHHKVVFFFLLSSLSLIANLSFTLIYVNISLSSRPPEAGIFYGGTGYNPAANPYVREGYLLFSVISFLLTWIASWFLLKDLNHHSGKLAFSFLIASLVAFLFTQSFPIMSQLLDPFITQDPIFYGFLISLLSFVTKIIGGILFGFGFLVIARSFPPNSTIRKYFVISSFGFALFFTSNQAIVLNFLPFPPYGLVAASFTGLASYLIMIGIYSSAISMAQDSKLRQVVRKTASNHVSLLENIGLSETEDTITKRVLEITVRYEQELKDATVIEPTYSKEDIEKYIHDVLEEVSLHRPTSSSSYKLIQHQLIEEWWKVYCSSSKKIRCSKETQGFDPQPNQTMKDIIYLDGYMGLRNLKEYRFEVNSGKQLFFPLIFKRLMITNNVGTKSENYGFNHIDLETLETTISYDNNDLSKLEDMIVVSDTIRLQCFSEDNSSTGMLEINFEGYWIHLTDIHIGEHNISLKSSTIKSPFLNYKLIVN
jgi:hypothetical protein